MTITEQTPIKTRKKLSGVENCIRIAFPKIKPLKPHYSTYTNLILHIGSNILDKSPLKGSEKISVVYDTDNQSKFLIKKNAEGYKLSISKEKTSYRSLLKWPFEEEMCDEARKTRRVSYEITEEGIQVYTMWKDISEKPPVGKVLKGKKYYVDV